MKANYFNKTMCALLLSAVPLASFAQDCVTEKGFVYSEDGFTVLSWKGPKYDNIGKLIGYDATYSGLYTADGKTLVHAKEPSSYYYVLYGTEVIGPNAFRSMSWYSYTNIYIPSTVKYIHPEAFSGLYNHGESARYCVEGIYDDCKPNANNAFIPAARSDENAEEVA